MTEPEDPQIPIVPGPSYDPPTAPMPAPVPPATYPIPQAGATPPPQPPEWRPARVAGNTVVVILTIVGIFVGLPLLCCLGWVAFGAIAGAVDPSLNR